MRTLAAILCLAATTAFADLPYLKISSDVQSPQKEFRLERTFSGNTPLIQWTALNGGTVADLTGWTFTFWYGKSSSATSGVAVSQYSVSSNVVLFRNITNFFASPNDYYCSVLGSHTSGAVRTWAVGTMNQRFDFAASSPRTNSFNTPFNWNLYGPYSGTWPIYGGTNVTVQTTTTGVVISASASGGGGAGSITNIPQVDAGFASISSNGGPQVVIERGTNVATLTQANSNTAAIASLTTNYVRRTGDTMSGQLRNDFGFAGPLIDLTVSNRFESSFGSFEDRVSWGPSISNDVLSSFSGTAWFDDSGFYGNGAGLTNLSVAGIVTGAIFLGSASGGITGGVLTVNATGGGGGSTNNLSQTLAIGNGAGGQSSTNWNNITATGTVTAANFAGNGGSLTNYSAANLAASTVIPASVVTGSFFIVSDTTNTLSITQSGPTTHLSVVGSGGVVITPGMSNSSTINYSADADQSFQVPAGISNMVWELWGAASAGAPGGHTYLSCSVTPLEFLTIRVGHGSLAATNGTSAGGWPGGGSGVSTNALYGCGGAGYTGVFRGTNIIGIAGGAGGFLNASVRPSGGGNQGLPLAASSNNGQGGSQTAGGSAATSTNTPLATAGAYLQGGNGTAAGGSAAAGMGGGGGIYGGGGGSAAASTTQGGGGSGFVNTNLCSAGFTDRSASDSSSPPATDSVNYPAGVGVASNVNTVRGGNGAAVGRW